MTDPDLATIARQPPGKQQALLRSRWVQPMVRGLLRAGVRRWVLINAMAAELADLEQMQDEAPDPEPVLRRFDLARKELKRRIEARRRRWEP